jgi:hypothetical protein
VDKKEFKADLTTLKDIWAEKLADEGQQFY